MSGVDNIIEMIDKKTAEKVDQIIRAAEDHKANTIQQAEAKAKEIEERILKAADQEYSAAIARQEASAKLQAKYQVLEAKESIISDILEGVEEQIKKVVKSKGYSNILTQLAVHGGSALSVDKLQLVFPKGQSDLIKPADVVKGIGGKVSVSISKETVRSTGGVVIRTPDGSKWVDNTFESRLERLHNDIRDKVSSIVFEE